ncbi:hypothetical protein M9H77_30150 [Catharanthus roseus]|uniref:Uncharacterized protein n=1 Tax=Catharanthus roseus TaxID=4058 RepID=A0ACB9ZWF3_CATRO|nr:hypothetical protein M9H77_30150 [Catharanthus roseus]
MEPSIVEEAPKVKELPHATVEAKENGHNLRYRSPIKEIQDTCKAQKSQTLARQRPTMDGRPHPTASGRVSRRYCLRFALYWTRSRFIERGHRARKIVYACDPVGSLNIDSE